ncbi:MAG: PH domain-containing protein [Hadesarchaea archaeon]|nr:PH domain-containing protein [Hadesarchaea archaeon]
MEKTIWEGSPELAAFYGFYVAGVLALALTATVALTLGLPLWVFGLVLPFCSAMFILPLFFQRAWRFVVTSSVVRSEFSFFVRHRSEAPLRKVTDIVVNQNFIDRLLHIGEVRFDTAGTLFLGVSFWGVKDPLGVAEKIRNIVLRA